MNIDHARLNIFVAQEFLDRSDIETAFKQMCGEGMPECKAEGDVLFCFSIHLKFIFSAQAILRSLFPIAAIKNEFRECNSCLFLMLQINPIFPERGNSFIEQDPSKLVFSHTIYPIPATPGEPGLTHSFLVFNEAESCFALLGAQLREFFHEICLFAATKSLAWTDFSASRTHPSLSPAVRICSADRWDGRKTSGQSVSGAL
jgi:hypothetical protein